MTWIADANGIYRDSAASANAALKIDGNFGTISSALTAKAARAPSPTVGHLATLDANGNPTDSGLTSSSFDTAGAAAAVAAAAATALATHAALTGAAAHGLGTASTHAAGDFDAAGSATAVQNNLNTLSATVTTNTSNIATNTASIGTHSTTLSALTGNQSANVFYGGPASGSAAAPGFRTICASDTPQGILPRFSGVTTTRIVTDLASGWNDLYTVPSGKLAVCLKAIGYNSAGTVTTVYSGLKTGGNYYNVGSVTGTVSATTYASINPPTSVTVFQAGDIFSLNASKTGVRSYFTIMLFDIPPGFKLVRWLSLATGDNTVYTVPSGKSFVVTNISPPFAFFVGNATVLYINMSGGTRTVNSYLVPSGGTSAANTLFATNSVTNNTAATLTLPFAMIDGDSLNLNVDAGTATQWGQFWGIEV